MSQELMNHDCKEAYLLLILHALDVAKDNLFKECIILSPDTDLFLLLIYYYQTLPNLAYFQIGKESRCNIHSAFHPFNPP